MQLSLVIITLNAEKSLKKCLETAKSLVQDIVIVDSGSTDQTLSIAKEYKAMVIYQPWLGFGPQKQFAVNHAKNDWVLCLDADEWISDNLLIELKDILKNPSFFAYQFPRCNKFMGRFLKYGEGFPDWSLRLFHRQYATWSTDLVHEYVKTNTPVGTLTGKLMHESGENLTQYLAKQNEYTTLQAEVLFRKGKKISLSKLLISPFWRFVRFYLLKRGFLDGLPGFVHISIGCFNSYLKYIKLIDLYRIKSQK